MKSRLRDVPGLVLGCFILLSTIIYVFYSYNINKKVVYKTDGFIFVVDKSNGKVKALSMGDAVDEYFEEKK